jgi:hypothetical protein
MNSAASLSYWAHSALLVAGQVELCGWADDAGTCSVIEIGQDMPKPAMKGEWQIQDDGSGPSASLRGLSAS